MLASPPMTDDPIRLPCGTKREVGPGGALVLMRYTDFDPRDVHEMQPIESHTVLDGETEALLFSSGPFGLFAGTARFTDDGHLEMTIGDLELKIDPAARIWAMDYDGWNPHPLDGDQAKIDVLVRPALKALHPPPAITTGAKLNSAQAKARHWAEILLFVGAIAFSGWLLITYGWKPYSRPKLITPTAVNTWLVTCPGIDGLLVFSINPDESLSAPPEISPVTLPLADGAIRTFSRGDLTIRFESHEAIVERGGDTMRCLPPR